MNNNKKKKKKDGNQNKDSLSEAGHRIALDKCQIKSKKMSMKKYFKRKMLENKS